MASSIEQLKKYRCSKDSATDNDTKRNSNNNKWSNHIYHVNDNGNTSGLVSLSKNSNNIADYFNKSNGNISEYDIVNTRHCNEKYLRDKNSINDNNNGIDGN